MLKLQSKTGIVAFLCESIDSKTRAKIAIYHIEWLLFTGGGIPCHPFMREKLLT